MKHYLWAVLAVLFVSAHASENPFDLEENLDKVDQAQSEMLADLQKLAEAKELAEEELDDDSDLDADEDEEDEETADVEQDDIEATGTEKVLVEKTTETVPTVKVAEETSETTALPEVKKGLSETESEREALLAAIKKTEDALKDAKTEQKIAADKLAAQEAEKAEAAKVELARQEQAKKDAIRKAAQAKEEEAREVAAYEKERAAKMAKEKEEAKVAAEADAKLAAAKVAVNNNPLPKELQDFKDIIEVKVVGKSKPLEGNVKDIFERLLKEKNNPKFALEDAKKVIEGNKEAGMAFVAYMMSKSLVRYNQLSPIEKKEFDKKSMDAIEKDMQNGSAKKSKKAEMDEYAKKYPSEFRALGFAFLEDIVTNGIPQVDFNMQMPANVSNDANKVNIEQGTTTAIVSDINITREYKEATKAADALYADAVKEMSQED